MGMREFLLILGSFLIGLRCIYRIRLLDRYEPEPFGKMVLVMILGGGCALIIALGLFEAIVRLGFQDFESVAGSLLVIGPVEEVAKFLGLLAVFGIIRNELNEPVDGIIYIACVALGFSLIENFLYAVHPASGHLLVVRLLVATPLHICFSSLMGLSFYLWYKNRQALHLLMTGYLLASLNHGIYDLIVLNHYSIILLGATVVLTYGFTRDLFIYALAVSPHRISLSQTIGAGTAAAAAGGVVCLHCGSKTAKRFYTINRYALHHCEGCDHFIVSLDGLFRLFYQFAGILKQKARKNLVSEDNQNGYQTLYEGNRICMERKMAVFRLDRLDAVLERLNYALKLRMKSKWYLPDNLYRLDQSGVEIDYSKMARNGKAAFLSWLVFFSFKRSRTHQPPAGGPLWHWAAFLLPELWYAVHGLWGVILAIMGIYLLALFVSIKLGVSMLLAMCTAAAVMRAVSGCCGSRIYFRRYGRWP